MAYTSGVFRIDLVSGSDAARTALTSCTASNPSGSITNIAKTGHGLVTGAVVDLTLFTSWLNSAWKITVVDADNFTLDDATWQATADTSGTATPRGGSSWSDAWLTVNSGATAARIQPGDEFRFAKTADPVSLAQDATWTDGSQTVTLTTAVTKKIEDAITGWTAAANISLSASAASRKMGATCILISPQSAFTTGKVAYKAVDGGGAQDFSGYQYINLWFRCASSQALNANHYKICLCSDTTGDTIVNEINLPAFLNQNAWVPLKLDYGGALDSSIQSVAIYANVDPLTNSIAINNIFASNDDLSLKTLIGKTGDVNYNIQSIDGVTIKIDSNNTAATGRGYSGSTSTETLYYRVPFDVTTSGTWATMNEAGNTLMPYNHYIGGYNTSNDTRDGMTCVASTIVGVGSAFSIQSFCKISYFTCARFVNINGGFNPQVDFDNVITCGCSQMSGSNVQVRLSNCKILNCSSTALLILGENSSIINSVLNNNTGYALQCGPLCSVISSSFANNGSASVTGQTAGHGLYRNCVFSDSTEFIHVANSYHTAWSFDHDDTPGNHWGFINGATINMQTSVVHGTEPVSWKITIVSSSLRIYKPVTLMLGPFTVAASALVTVKAWIKKDHATNVAAKLYVKDALYTIDGVAADDATKADDTSWEELTITFTPTEKGAVPVFVDAWYVGGASNVYVGSITVTQA